MAVIAIVPSRKCIFKEISFPFFSNILEKNLLEEVNFPRFFLQPLSNISLLIHVEFTDSSQRNRKSHPFFPSLQFLANLSFSFIYLSRLNRREKGDLIQFNLI